MNMHYVGYVRLDNEIQFPRVPQIPEGQVFITDTDRGKLAVMTQATWNQFGSMVESLRQAMRHIDRQMKHNNEQLEIARRMNADLTVKYNKLRETTSASRRASVESIFKPGVAKG